jgi:hypothetical protein
MIPAGRKALIGLTAMIVLVGCTGNIAAPTATSVLPTFDDRATLTPVPPTLITTETEPTAATAPPLEADRLWGERPLGKNTVGLYLYGVNGRRCLRYLADVHTAQVHTICETAAGQSMIATSSIETDSTGSAFTVIAGRVLNARITAVSVEILGGSTVPVVVQDEAFIAVQPGSLTPLRAVPIDEHGNLVGNLFTFGK